MKKKNLILIPTAVILALLVIIAGIIFIKMNGQKQTNEERERIDRVETEPENVKDRGAAVEKEPEALAQQNLHGSYTPLVTGKMGSHIYFTDNLLKNRNLTEDDEKEIREYLEQADKKLTENVLVVGWSGQSADNSLMFNAYQYVDGVVVPKVFYRLTQEGGVSVKMISDIPAIRSFDTAGLVDPEDLFTVVDDLAWQHRLELYMAQDDKIYVLYHLEYDTIKDELYYYFMINDYSRIMIDAKTKDILEEYYFNGEYID